METSASTKLIKNAITVRCQRCGAIATHPSNWVFRFDRHKISALSGKLEWILKAWCPTCAQINSIKSNLKEILTVTT